MRERRVKRPIAVYIAAILSPLLMLLTSALSIAVHLLAVSSYQGPDRANVALSFEWQSVR